MLDAKEERQYKQLRKLGQELHIQIPEAFLTLEVFDKDGKLIQRHKQRSHSWVRNAYNLLFVSTAGKGCTGTATFGPGEINVKDTGGTIQGVDGDNLALAVGSPDDVSSGYRAGAGIDTFGILVGSGTNAESFVDYFLQTQIANGVGAGQLSHVESELNNLSYISGTKTLKNELVRFFNNNSGGNVSVNEIALVTHGRCGDAGTNDWLQSRDKLASTVTIPDTGQLKVTYTVQLIYPA